MSPQIDRYIALLDQRLRLLRALGEQLVGCRKEFVAMDLDGIYRCIAEKEGLCRQIRSLDLETEAMQQVWAQRTELDAAGQFEYEAWAERLRGLMHELALAGEEVRRLNQVHSAYLRRSLQTLNLLKNSLGNYALTYAPREGFTTLTPGSAGRG